MSLGSADPNRTFCCLNGIRRANGCKLTTFKAVKHVEQAVLSHLTKLAFTKEFLVELVDQANNYVREEAKRPKEDPKPLERRLKCVRAECERLAEAIATSVSGGESLRKKYAERERTLAEIDKELQRIKNQQLPVPPPIKAGDVLVMLDDLYQLLVEDVAVSAPVLRKVLGPIEIEEAEGSKRGRPIWKASFSIDLVPALLVISRRKQLPTTNYLEFLTIGRWKFSKSVELQLRNVPKYEEIGPKVMALKSQGFSDEVISRKTGETVSNIRYARLFAEIGERPKVGPPRKRTGTGVKSFYKEIADQVVYLRDIQKMHFKDIATHLGKAQATVRKAYDSKKPLVIEAGKRPRRGESERLSPEIHREIEELIRYGCFSPSEIARACKCGLNTVLRKKRNLTHSNKD
jgi:DNA repair exonuclease SbcCD ATPase subunit